MEKQFQKDWLTEGLMDFEYKKYLLLAYLQYARKNFSQIMLYPPLAELIQQYHELSVLKERQEQSLNSFKKELRGFDFEKFRLIYHDVSKDENSISIVKDLIEYALPEIKLAIEEGKDIYDFLEKQLRFQPIGLSPIYRDEGYLLLQDSGQEINIYRYSLSKIICDEQHYRSLYTEFLTNKKRSFINTPEQLKLWLAKEFTDLPQPAVFEIHSELDLPLNETYLPLAKRLLLKELSTAA